MKTQLPKLESWKKRIRQVVAEGKSEAEAIRSVIHEDVGKYIGVLEECGYEPGMILDNLKRHGL